MSTLESMARGTASLASELERVQRQYHDRVKAEQERHKTAQRELEKWKAEHVEPVRRRLAEATNAMDRIQAERVDRKILTRENKAAADVRKLTLELSSREADLDRYRAEVARRKTEPAREVQDKLVDEERALAKLRDQLAEANRELTEARAALAAAIDQVMEGGE